MKLQNIIIEIKKETSKSVSEKEASNYTATIISNFLRENPKASPESLYEKLKEELEFVQKCNKKEAA